jgi:hypothetical protein
MTKDRFSYTEGPQLLNATTGAVNHIGIRHSDPMDRRR